MEAQNTYDKITLAQCRALREQGAPRAIPTMCVLAIKPDKKMNPHQAKLHLIVLGNYNDRIWLKSEKYSPILCPDTMPLIISMAVKQNVHLIKVTARMRSIKAFFLWTKSLSLSPQLVL